MNGHEILLTVHGICDSVRWSRTRSAERLASTELSVLTKEKLRHYLAFECAIREIAAVSDRHCLATDNPTYKRWPAPLRSDLRDGVHCSFSLSLSLSLSLSRRVALYSPFSFLYFIIHNSRVPCMQCTYTIVLVCVCVYACARQLRSR